MPQGNSTASSIHDRLGDDKPTSIKLSDGDVFIGTFDHIERGESAYGPCYIAVFSNPDTSGMLEPPTIPDGGSVSVWMFHAALLSQMKRLRPTKGERLGIKRHGKTTSGGDRTYVDYTVVSERTEAGEVGWDEIVTDEELTERFNTRHAGQFNDPPDF